MIKVLYLMNHAGKAGTERYVQTLIEKLNGKNIQAYFAYNENGLLVDRLEELGIETFNIKMKSPFDISAAKKLAKLCKKLGIDIIHTQYLRENYVAIISKIMNNKVQVIYTNHFIMANGFLHRFCNRIITRFEAGIIAVCNKGKDMLIRNGNRASIITVLFNAVDPEYWKDPVISTLRKDYNIPENEIVMLCASRFAHDKGHKYLVNSISELKKITDVKFKLVLAGDGPLLEETKQQVNSQGLQADVIFTGFKSDIKNMYYGSDIYVNSSEHEALSFLIIEALASGLPVLATDMGGNRDIINDDTNCGLLITYDNAKQTAIVMKKLIEDEKLRKAFKSNAYMAVLDRFNIDIMAKQTYNIYEKAKKYSSQKER